MEQFIGCDAHKKYSVFVAVNERGEASPAIRVGHDREQYRQFLERLPAGSQIALEAGGDYYWMVDEMEAAGHPPRLVHPLEAKKRMGKTGKKTDKEDANGLGILLRNGTLPEVWIPPSVLRDQRESLRLRMFLVQQRTRLKNRIQEALASYNIQIAGVSDLFGGEGRLRLGPRLGELPEHTRQSVELELVTLDFFFSSRRRHTRFDCDWSSDVCSSDLPREDSPGGGSGQSRRGTRAPSRSIDSRWSRRLQALRACGRREVL